MFERSAPSSLVELAEIAAARAASRDRRHPTLLQKAARILRGEDRPPPHGFDLTEAALRQKGTYR